MLSFKRKVLLGAATAFLVCSMILAASCSSASAPTTTGLPAAPATSIAPTTATPGIPQGNSPLRGTSGTLTAISANTLTLNSLQGQTISVKYIADTVIHKSVNGALSDLKTGDIVVITASKDAAGTLVAKSITSGTETQQFGQRGNAPAGTNFPANSAAPSRPLSNGTPPAGFSTNGNGQFISGTISSLTANSLIVKTADGQSTTIQTDANTGISLNIAGSSSDLQIGSFITVGGDTGSDGTVNATSISIQPAGFQFPQSTSNN